MIIIVFLFIIVFMGLSSVNAVAAASGDMIYVDSHGDDSWDGLSAIWTSGTTTGPKLSIKNATGTVNNGGTVSIANGVYTGENNANIIIDKDMTIIGQSKNGTIINGTGASNGIFNIQNGTHVVIQNLTISNSNTSNVGSILNNGTLTVNNSVFKDNTALGGGAITNIGNLTVINSTFLNNTVISTNDSTMGGAIFNIGNLSVKNSNFTNNVAVTSAGDSNVTAGGAISNMGILNITGSIFTHNKANSINAIGIGGAISNTGKMDVSNSKFINNDASGDGNSMGGAISNYGTITFKNSTFSGNIADYGGAIYNYNGNISITGGNFTANTAINGGVIVNYGNLNISGSNFLNNTANGAEDNSMGGGVIANIGNLTVTGSTFTGNIADYGGAISNFGGTSTKPVKISSSTFTHNTANTGGAIWNYGILNVTGSKFTSNTASTTNENLAYDGGAISNDGNLKVTGSTFTGNIADLGGAISNQLNSNATVSGSTFTYNSATIDGDAIYNEGKLSARFCRIVANGFTGYVPEDIYSDGGSADVKYNWWGSNAGPSKNRVIGASAGPWMVLTLSASPTTIKAGGTSTVSANFLYDSNGVYHSYSSGYVPDGMTVGFTTQFGTIGSKAYTVNGIAKSTLKAGSTGGVVNVSAKADSQTVQIPLKVISTYPKNYATGCSRTATIYLKFSG
ncbi:beta strand repeat-containing protein, partial [Methanobacterium sp.]|uniref:beta strand repeat-containing protein n=1 Tax=Methanobacterium sp. TaxID=2164 RepID=UPI003C71F164